MFENVVIVIDGTMEYKVRINRERWERSTKPYLIDCGYSIMEAGTFEDVPEIIDDSQLSDLLEPRDI